MISGQLDGIQMVCCQSVILRLLSDLNTVPVFAQQGYFTVALNPTGSSSFGQGF
jgi:hypothetical protein